jgi:hypothetical protein
MRERFEEGREKLAEYMQANRLRVMPDSEPSPAIFLARADVTHDRAKRVSVTDLCQYAIHNIGADSTDIESRTSAPARARPYDHEGR